MDTEIFYSRICDTNAQLASFINNNKIRKDQIVSINQKEFQSHNKRDNYVGVINFFYTGDLQFDFYVHLSQERKKSIEDRIFDFPNFTENEFNLITNYMGSEIGILGKDRLYKLDFTWHPLRTIFNLIVPFKKEDEPQSDFEYLKLLQQLNPDIQLKFDHYYKPDNEME